MVENYQLRYNTRMQLGNGIFHSRWLTMLLVCASIYIASAVCASLLIGSLLFFVIEGALEYGIARATVSCARGNRFGVGQLASGFTEGFVRTFLLYLVRSVFLFLWTLLFIIPGIVKSYSYAMVYYLQQEPGGTEKELTELITESRYMMDGYKWKLFCLDFSFFGWYILGALCLGIGVFFVEPYHQTARANFYLALRAERGV